MKNTVTNICGLIVAVGGAILTAHASGQITLPISVVTGIGIAVAVSTAIIGYFTGKPEIKK